MNINERCFACCKNRAVVRSLNRQVTWGQLCQACLDAHYPVGHYSRGDYFAPDGEPMPTSKRSVVVDISEVAAAVTSDVSAQLDELIAEYACLATDGFAMHTEVRQLESGASLTTLYLEYPNSGSERPLASLEATVNLSPSERKLELVTRIARFVLPAALEARLGNRG